MSASRRPVPMTLADTILLWGILLVGLVPYLPVLDLWPWGPDATKWISYGDTAHAGWWDWVWNQRHFVGYRPAAAASYVVNSATTGWDPWFYRATDLALHGMGGLALFAFARHWVSSNKAALVALGCFLAHPAVEVVVPHVSRRSYSLGLMLGLFAALAWIRAIRTEGTSQRFPLRRGLWWMLAVLLQWTALLAHEVNLVWVPLLALLPVLLGASQKRWLHVGLSAATACVAPAIYLWKRYAVLGQLGGYTKHYYAYTDGVSNQLKEMDSPQLLELLSASLTYPIRPSSSSGAQPLLDGAMGDVLTLAVGGYLMFFLCLIPLLTLRKDSSRGPLLACMWFLGLVAGYAFSGTWFWRHGYFLAAALSLGGACLIDQHILKSSHVRRGLHAIPLGLLSVSMCWHSPLVRGIGEQPLDAAIYGSKLVNQSLAFAGQMPRESTIWMALSAKPSLSHIARIWLNRSTRDQRHTFRLLAVLGPTPRSPGMRTLQLHRAGPRVLIDLHDDMQWYAPEREEIILDEQGALALHRLSETPHRTFLVFSDRGKLRIRSVPARPRYPKSRGNGP